MQVNFLLINMLISRVNMNKSFFLRYKIAWYIKVSHK